MDICFLNYISRSGSTLLASLLDANPEVFVTIEADLPKDIVKGETRSKEELLPILKKISKDNKFKNWDLSVEEMYNNIDLPVSNIGIWKQVLLLYYQKQVNKQERKAKTIVFKGFRPSLYEFEEIVSAHLSYKMLYVYRDPRAVYNSQSKKYDTSLRLPFTASPFEFADKWKDSIRKMHRLNERDSFKSIRYEDLVRKPQKTLEEVFNFLCVNQIVYDDFTVKGYKSKIPENQRALHKLVGKSIDKKRITAWEKELDINSIKVIENIAGEQMKNCAYELYAENKPEVSPYFKLKTRVKQVSLNYRKNFKRRSFSILKRLGFR